MEIMDTNELIIKIKNKILNGWYLIDGDTNLFKYVENMFYMDNNNDEFELILLRPFPIKIIGLGKKNDKLKKWLVEKYHVPLKEFESMITMILYRIEKNKDSDKIPISTQIIGFHKPTEEVPSFEACIIRHINRIIKND